MLTFETARKAMQLTIDAQKLQVDIDKLRDLSSNLSHTLWTVECSAELRTKSHEMSSELHTLMDAKSKERYDLEYKAAEMTHSYSLANDDSWVEMEVEGHPAYMRTFTFGDVIVSYSVFGTNEDGWQWQQSVATPDGVQSDTASSIGKVKFATAAKADAMQHMLG